MSRTFKGKGRPEDATIRAERKAEKEIRTIRQTISRANGR